MRTTQPPAIRLQDLRFSWGNHPEPLLDIAGFTIPQGEKVFIQGPSGSGKSTLLSLIGGVMTPQAGDIAILGQSLRELKGGRRDRFRVAHIGFIFQLFNLIPYLSVLENVLISGRFSPERRRRLVEHGAQPVEEALRLLAALGLRDPGLIARPVTELSVGQQQRVAAARALLGSPEILIADEPTSSLDADAKQAFLQILFEECGSAGTTVVFVSHDSSLGTGFDRVVKLADINRAAEAAA